MLKMVIYECRKVKMKKKNIVKRLGTTFLPGSIIIAADSEPKAPTNGTVAVREDGEDGKRNEGGRVTTFKSIYLSKDVMIWSHYFYSLAVITLNWYFS